MIYENGMIGLKKDYFWAGKIDRAVFNVENVGNNENL